MKLLGEFQVLHVLQKKKLIKVKMIMVKKMLVLMVPSSGRQ